MAGLVIDFLGFVCSCGKFLVTPTVQRASIWSWLEECGRDKKAQFDRLCKVRQIPGPDDMNYYPKLKIPAPHMKLVPPSGNFR
jgi:hypothetical protein